MTISRPIPGQAKIVSTNTEPATVPGSASANSVTIGARRFASTCRRITTRSASPFARAVRTQSAPMASSALVRTYRATPAAPIAASSVTGRIACRSESARCAMPCSSAPGVVIPTAGSRSHSGMLSDDAR